MIEMLVVGFSCSMVFGVAAPPTAMGVRFVVAVTLPVAPFQTTYLLRDIQFRLSVAGRPVDGLAVVDAGLLVGGGPQQQLHSRGTQGAPGLDGRARRRSCTTSSARLE